MRLIIVLLCILHCGQQRTAAQLASNRVLPFAEARGQPAVIPAHFEFSALGYTYRISNKGRGRRVGGGTATRYFNLRLSKGDSLEHSIYYAEYEGDLLLICEVGDEESGAGFITRLDGQTLRMKWKRKIPAFNLGPGLIEDNHVYLTAIGFIARVNLNSGTFAWKHTNLYRHGDFNSFELPRVEGSIVTFKEVESYDDPAKTISVAKGSGKIVRVSPDGPR